MLMAFVAFEAARVCTALSRVLRHGMLFVQSESEKPSARCASDKQHFKDVRKTTLDFLLPRGELHAPLIKANRTRGAQFPIKFLRWRKFNSGETRTAAALTPSGFSVRQKANKRLHFRQTKFSSSRKISFYCNL